MLPKTIDNCVIFRSNGVWDSKNEMFCPDIKTCPVCSFSSVPKLTMLGLPPESTIDYYWYLDKDENGTIYYDGYKDLRKIVALDKFYYWNVITSNGRKIYNIEIQNVPGTPIG